MGRHDGQHILVLGLGVSGMAAAELAHSRGARVTVLDSGGGAALEERAERLASRDVKVQLDFGHSHWPEAVDLVVLSPGIAPESALGKLAATVTAPVVGELEFGYCHCACPVLAVTGTNGKTTTVELAVHCLRGAGYRVVGGGNLGLPLAEAARRSGALDFVVAEVSSFQLERIARFTPLVAAILNLGSDHLDRYGDVSAYWQATLGLLRRLRGPAQAVLHRDLLDYAEVQALPLWQRGRPVTFAADDGADFHLTGDHLVGPVAGEPQALLPRAELKLAGPHNAENALAALAVGHAAGVSAATLAPHLGSFAPREHRLELVTVAGGCRVINDSKSTNPESLIAALQACGGSDGVARNGHPRIRLLAGGRDKQMAFAAAIPHLQQYVCEVYLLGETRQQLAATWGPQVPCRQFDSLSAAVGAALEDAQPGDTVLFSPGCASFDMFTDYRHRGNQFISEVTRRLEE